MGYIQFVIISGLIIISNKGTKCNRAKVAAWEEAVMGFSVFDGEPW